MNSPRLWIALTRPDNLVSALAVARALRGRCAGCCLVYENSAWWQAAAWDRYRPLFDEIHAVDKVTSCRGLRDVPRFYRALKARQTALRALRIGPGDLLVVLAGITALGNAVASAYPDVTKLFCTTVKKYADASRPYSFGKYRHTTSGWLQYRWLEPWAGLRRTLHLKPWRGGGDGVRLERLEDSLDAVYDEVLLLSNDGTGLPSGAGLNVHPTPFPSLADVGATTGSAAGERPAAARKVVFFGTPFLLVRNLSAAAYAGRLNDCLDYLRRCYGAECELIYRPHPAETTERQRLGLDGFRVEEDRQVAELYFLQHARQIAAVFSVSSTVSRVALNFGLDGYALWRCFPFDAGAAAYFESLMGRVPAAFDIRSLERPPVSYAGVGASGDGHAMGFTAALQAACDRLGIADRVAPPRPEKAVATALGTPV